MVRGAISETSISCDMVSIQHTTSPCGRFRLHHRRRACTATTRTQELDYVTTESSSHNQHMTSSNARLRTTTAAERVPTIRSGARPASPTPWSDSRVTPPTMLTKLAPRCVTRQVELTVESTISLQQRRPASQRTPPDTRSQRVTAGMHSASQRAQNAPAPPQLHGTTGQTRLRGRPTL